MGAFAQCEFVLEWLNFAFFVLRCFLPYYCRFDSNKFGRHTLHSQETLLQRIETVDLNQLIRDKVTSCKEYIFIYLTYSIPRSSEHFTPYSLKEAKYSEIDPNEYYTVDRKGVTYFSRRENHFTKLDVWQTEYDLYLKMIKVLLGCVASLITRINEIFSSWERSANTGCGKDLKFGKSRYIGKNIWRRGNFWRSDCS